LVLTYADTDLNQSINLTQTAAQIEAILDADFTNAQVLKSGNEITISATGLDDYISSAVENLSGAGAVLTWGTNTVTIEFEKATDTPSGVFTWTPNVTSGQKYGDGTTSSPSGSVTVSATPWTSEFSFNTSDSESSIESAISAAGFTLEVDAKKYSDRIEIRGRTPGYIYVTHTLAVVTFNNVTTGDFASRTVVSDYAVLRYYEETETKISADLSQSSAAIEAAITASGADNVSVSKSGTQVNVEFRFEVYREINTSSSLPTKTFTPDDYGSLDVSGTGTKDCDITFPGINEVQFLFSADDPATVTTLSAETAVRQITVASHGLSQGDDVCLFNGDTVLPATYVVEVIDSDTFTIPVGILSGRDNTATHIADESSGRTDYPTGTVNAKARITYAFFIPGVTSGITTAADIPTIQGDTTPQDHLNAVVNSDTYIQADNSQLEPLFPYLYVRSISEVLTNDVYSAN
jgi:hypothetical protein